MAENLLFFVPSITKEQEKDSCRLVIEGILVFCGKISYNAVCAQPYL